MRLVLCFLFMLSACAKSNYAPSRPLNQEGKALPCEAQFKPSGVCMTLIWKKAPQGKDSPGIFLLKIFRTNPTDGRPVLEDGAEIVGVILEMDMSGTTHGGSIVQIRKTEPGTYEITNVYGMDGEWNINVTLSLGGSAREAATVVTTFN